MGSGLGLYITKEIAKLSGGDVKAFSRVGVGSNFVLCIPTYYKPKFVGRKLVDHDMDYNDLAKLSLDFLLVDDSPTNI